MTHIRPLLAVCALALLAACTEQDPAPVVIPEVRTPPAAISENPLGGSRFEVEVADNPLGGAGEEEPEEKDSLALPQGPIGDSVEAASPVEVVEARPADPAGDEQVIGLLLPLGDVRHQQLAQALRSAAILAIEESGDPRLRLTVHDTVPNPAAAARKAVDAGARILVGPLFADEVTRIRTVVDVAGINAISLSTDIGVAGEGVFLAGSLPQLEAQRILRYALSRGHERFGAILPRTEYGQIMLDTMDRTLADHGGRRVILQQYSEGFESVREATRRFVDDYRALREASPRLAPTAVLLPVAGIELKTMAAYLIDEQVDLRDLQLLGTGLWDSRETLDLAAKEGLPVLGGAWFAAPAARFRRAFEARFLERFGYRPPNLAAFAFDATGAAMVIAEEGFSAAAITDPAGFAGVTGTFHFRQDGTIERRLAILEVAEGRFQVLEAAERDLLEY